jgi:hypothetical protein
MPLTLETAQAFFQLQLSALDVVTATLTGVNVALGVLIFCTIWGCCRAFTGRRVRGLRGA